MEALIWAVIVLAIYFAPMITAYSRNHKNKAAISALNILLGWTLIGWVVALVWSLTDNVSSK